MEFFTDSLITSEALTQSHLQNASQTSDFPLTNRNQTVTPVQILVNEDVKKVSFPEDDHHSSIRAEWSGI